VAALLRERAPVSARLIFVGSGAGLLLGACFAWLAVWPRNSGAEAFSLLISGGLLAIPPAVLALFFFLEQAPLWLAVSIAVFPRVFGTIRAILAGVFASPALLAARARGVRPLTLAVRHVVSPALSQWIALAGVTLVLAFGLIVPIEALCDVPGLGQLAWKAALSRDLPLLCGLALLITLIAAVAHSIGELAGWRRRT
jgi:peptide/nickel transport system permease protein